MIGFVWQGPLTPRFGTQRLAKYDQPIMSVLICSNVFSVIRCSSVPTLCLRRPWLRRTVVSDAAQHTRTSLSRTSALMALAVASCASATYFLWPSKSRAAPTIKERAISPFHFTPVTVSATEPCGPDLKLLTLKISLESLPSKTAAPAFAPIWSVFIKDDDIQVERPYTPLEGVDGEGNIKLWVKRYPKGEVGRWLHTKCVGDTVEIRGPLKTFSFDEKKWDEVVLVSSLKHGLIFAGL